MEPKLKIGDLVYRATFTSQDDSLECPDCGGTGRIRVIFHDDSIASIDCGNCAKGYNPPTGRVTTYRRTPAVSWSNVVGYEVSGTEIKYKLHNCYHAGISDIFDNEADALVRAQEMCDAATAEEERRILTKEKDTRSWAWNASYHRREIKDAERRIECNKKKLSVASLKAKEGEKL